MLIDFSAHAASIDPSDPNILYTGRWEDSTPSQPWAQAKSSSIVANFQGTRIAVTMTTASQEYFRIIIDDDAAGSMKTLIPSGVQFTLASGLADSLHKIEIVKETDWGRTTFLGFEVDDGRALAPPPARPPRRIVFYGDSNLAGYSLESERNQGATDLLGSYYTYAGITARMFDAEYRNISKSGATISSLNSAYDRVDWDSNLPAWDFNDFLADVVVVNIGANDWWRPKSSNKSRYHALLDDLRTSHPGSHIMLYNAYGWDDMEPANYIHEVIAERNDPNMSYATFPWLFEQYHGCEYDHGGMALYLSLHLSSVMGWTAGPQDVMSGYGLEQNVANGSFEEVAPFGGWGWRYLDDPGVNRVYDPNGAYHGDYYLRLSNGATSQQTNPASDGEEFPLAVWMRGADNGAQVAITMGFRDQAAGAEVSSPMHSLSETKVLTTEWHAYSMTATAPSAGADPVYSMRVTFEAALGDTVDIDSVAVAEPSKGMLLSVGGASVLALYSLRRNTRRERFAKGSALPSTAGDRDGDPRARALHAFPIRRAQLR